jgi:hypothetical protein
MQTGTKMQATKPAEIVFCNSCDKATYWSSVSYHRENPCHASMMGWDCMEFEAEEQFCRCEVK